MGLESGKGEQDYKQSGKPTTNPFDIETLPPGRYRLQGMGGSKVEARSFRHPTAGAHIFLQNSVSEMRAEPQARKPSIAAFDPFQNLMKIKARHSSQGHGAGLAGLNQFTLVFVQQAQFQESCIFNRTATTPGILGEQEMKQLVAFWVLIGTIGHDKTMRATLSSGLAIALVLAAGVPTAQADDNPQQCVAFDADLIDEKFLEWSDTTGFDPNINTIRCIDYHWVRPTTVFEAKIDDGTFFRAVVTISPVDPNKNYAFGESWYSDYLDFWSNTDDDDVFGWLILPTSRAHICRANILQSLTWQLYCPGNINQ